MFILNSVNIGRLNRYLQLCLIVLSLCPFWSYEPVFAQTDPPVDFNTWINRKVEDMVKARLNQRDKSKEIETPAISGNSTSLVEQSSPPDWASLALNLAGLSDESEEDKTTSFSTNFSAYAVYAAAKGMNPLDPSFYTDHRSLRRISFTLGFEYPDEEGASGNERATLLGSKFLIWNKRDAADPANAKHIKKVSDELKASSVQFRKTVSEIKEYLFRSTATSLGISGTDSDDSLYNFEINYLNSPEQLSTLLQSLTNEQIEAIDRIISNNIEPELKTVQTISEVVEAIKRAPQLSIEFQGRLRKEDGVDEYRTQVTFDYGVAERLNLTLNSSFDYKDGHDTLSDTRGGRIALEFQYEISEASGLTAKSPWKISLAGEGNWLTHVTPTYEWQLKINAPVISGIDIAISFSRESGITSTDKSQTAGRVGFVLDFAKLSSND